MKLLHGSLSALALFLALGGCAQNPATNQTDFVLMTEAEELSVGSAGAQVIAKYFGVYDDDALQNYVRKVSHKLAANSDRPKLPWSFTVLDTPAFNAFSLPGGHVFITRGALATLRTEDQLAAAVAHQIAHVAARHHVRQHAAFGGAAWQGKTVALLPGLAGQAVVVPGASNINMSFSVPFEAEAETKAASYLASSGYTPRALEGFRRIARSAATTGSTTQAYHAVAPSLDEATNYESPEVAGQPEKESAYLAAIDGMVFGHSAHDGLIVGDQFMHLGLNTRIDLPVGWQHDNQPHAVVSLSKSGAKVELSVESRKNQVSPRSFLARRVGAESLSNVRELYRDERAAVFATAAVNRGGAKALVRAAAIFLGETAVLVVGYPGRGVSAESYDREFLAAYESIAALSEQDMRNVQVRRIKVIPRAEAGATALTNASDARALDPLAPPESADALMKTIR